MVLGLGFGSLIPGGWKSGIHGKVGIHWVSFPDLGAGHGGHHCEEETVRHDAQLMQFNKFTHWA